MAERKSVCKKVFVDETGEKTRSATENATGLEFHFSNGNTHTVAVNDHPENIVKCLTLFGISEKYGNAYAGAKGDSDVAEELFLSMQEQLTAGTWVSKADGVGPRPSMVADAIIAAILATGDEVDEDRKAAIVDKVKDKDIRKAALKDPSIAAEYDAIRAKKAAEKAEKSREAANESESVIEGF